MKVEKNNFLVAVLPLIAMCVMLFGEALHPCFHTESARAFEHGGTAAECAAVDNATHASALTGAVFCPLCANLLVSTAPDKVAELELASPISARAEYVRNFIGRAAITIFPRGPPSLT